MKHLIWITLLAFSMVLAACGSSPGTPLPAPTNVALTPDPFIFTSAGVVASAETVPAHETHMSFPISGPVKEVMVREGDLVKAGQPLISLSSPDLELSVTSAELALKSAVLDLDYWLVRFDRPPERREQARAETDQARTKLVTAQAAYEQSVLIAPFEGTVVELRVQAGELALPGQVVIIIGDLTDMQIRTTDLSELDVPRLRTGQAANVYLDALDLNVTGRVIQVSPISETVGGDVVYPVTLELDEQPQGLLWGMTAEVEIHTE